MQVIVNVCPVRYINASPVSIDQMMIVQSSEADANLTTTHRHTEGTAIQAIIIKVLNRYSHSKHQLITIYQIFSEKKSKIRQIT